VRQYDIRKHLGARLRGPDAGHHRRGRLLAAARPAPTAAATRAGRFTDWHPLISGDPESVHRAGESVRGWTVPEFEVPEEEWEDHIIDGGA
jgi:hypothetical protein